MNLKKLGVDSMAVAVALAVGCSLGYVYAAAECAHIKQAAEEQAIFFDGRWVYRTEIIDMLKKRGRTQREDYR